MREGPTKCKSFVSERMTVGERDRGKDDTIHLSPIFLCSQTEVGFV